MRKWLPLAVLLGTVLVTTASSRASAQGQSVQAGIAEGEKLSLSFEVLYRRWESEMKPWIANADRHETTINLWKSYPTPSPLPIFMS